MLNAKTQKWLKGAHIIFPVAWLGAALAVLALTYGGSDAGAIKLVEDRIAIPASYGSLLTALGFSLLTGWGFFKHRWVTAKWVLLVLQIVFLSGWLGRWINDAAALTPGAPAYLHYRMLIAWFGPLQVLFLVAMILIAVRKPWGKGEEKRPAGRTESGL